MIGFDIEWCDYFEEQGVMFGFIIFLMFLIGVTFIFVQVEEQMIVKEVMEVKEKYMKVLGVKLFEENQVVKIVIEFNNELMVKYFVLLLCVVNFNEVFEVVLCWCVKYFGLGDKVKFIIK